jgi:hypothetical protein
MIFRRPERRRRVGERGRSGGLASITVVQSAEDWKLDDFASRRFLDRARNRTVPLEATMSPSVMVVVQILAEHAPKVLRSEEDHVIQALSTNRSDQSFHVRILPRRTRAINISCIWRPATRRRNSAP